MPRPPRPPAEVARPRRHTRPAPRPITTAPGRVAIVGAGIAGITAARTLAQAGWQVSVFDKSRGPGGRMATRRTPFGGFDHGAQFFTVRDERFAHALRATAAPVQPWVARRVRVLDAEGQHLVSPPPGGETRWVAVPGMSALVKYWAQDLEQGKGQRCWWSAEVLALQPDALTPRRWQLHVRASDDTPPVHGGFDAVLLALPHPQAAALLHASAVAAAWQERLQDEVRVAPCWTLMLAWPQAPQTPDWGPPWDAARSDHHRIAWVARETSKPERGAVARWVVQAAPSWSADHLEDDPQRVTAKLLRAFADLTGIAATPEHAVAHRWRYAQTQRPLGEPCLWDAPSGLGLCGDWCLGHRVEHAFLSGLELALSVLETGRAL
ncbi:NAD(P)/FAD-dependent oxidoreductase [Tepidimonas charontis]|uniref:Renalase n=1 Tax=Tepidimonas charontis TaxID=2267262 RepID=A0A554XDK9_9BURK|nr:FAD-dependent oxidoreductase [Tepidimonas charontis]TSE33879.1 Renalase [Tepidimonas charontis]